MIFRQLFDYETYTYTYLLGDPATKNAALIDPVLNNLKAYLTLLADLGLRLVVAMDTHVHADHITALGQLRESSGCKTFLGNEGVVSCADSGLEDGLIISVGEMNIRVIYTPGHTDDSYCFLVKHSGQDYLFTGDTLLIRSCGRTDFQNGSPQALYQSIHQRLLTLPDETIVFPGHDYKGWTSSTIGEERRCNPRLALASEQAFVDHMNNLNLPSPKWMDVAVPANLSCGKS